MTWNKTTLCKHCERCGGLDIDIFNLQTFTTVWDSHSQSMKHQQININLSQSTLLGQEKWCIVTINLCLYEKTKVYLVVLQSLSKNTLEY